jgi:AraC-like DNA-binding protein
MIRIKNNRIVLTKFPLQPDDQKILALPEKWYGPDEYSRFFFFTSGEGELFIKNQDSISIIPHTVLLLNRSLTFKIAKSNLKGFCLCCTDQFLQEGTYDDVPFNEDAVSYIPKGNLRIMASYLFRLEKKALYYTINSESINILMDFYKLTNFNPICHKKRIPSHLYVSAYTAYTLFQQAFQYRNTITVVNKVIYQQIKSYIENNYTLNFKISEISAGNPYSDDKMGKIFKHHHNMSIIDYRNELRIEKTKLRLQQRELSIAEIALDVGFNDQNSFAKIFKRLTGKSPKQYQTEHKRQ